MNFGDQRLPGNFWSRCIPEPNSGCWLWTGYLNRDGYGKFTLKGRSSESHRWAYRFLVGEIPAGLQIDHRCRTRNCVNPLHMEAVTARVNVLRSTAPAALQFRQTQCIRGHEFTPENTGRTHGGRKRYCRICSREKEKRRPPRQRSRKSGVIGIAGQKRGR